MACLYVKVSDVRGTYSDRRSLYLYLLLETSAFVEVRASVEADTGRLCGRRWTAHVRVHARVHVAVLVTARATDCVT